MLGTLCEKFWDRLGWVKSCTPKKLLGYVSGMILLLGNPGTDRDLCLYLHVSSSDFGLYSLFKCWSDLYIQKQEIVE